MSGRWAFLCLCSLASSGCAFLLNRDVCYEDLGCFEANDFRSLQRPIVHLPNSPQVINTTFWLYTRNEKGSSSILEEELSYYDTATIKLSQYSPDRGTKIIIHGYTHDSRQPWVQQMVKSFLSSEEDLNVIAVNWQGGAKFPYPDATGNSILVGSQIEKLIRIIVEEKGNVQPLSSFHLIGHGLGAHVAGYAGAKAAGDVGRITGLDPTGLYFEGAPLNVRLDAGDAQFVDVIHTDGSSIVTNLGTGLMQASGHVDFYPNGGSNQPGCNQRLSSKLVSAVASGITGGLDGAADVIGCSNMASVRYFIESISTDCPFMGYQCQDFATFDSGKCLDCGSDGSKCTKLGYRVSRSASGSYYMKTQAQSPYCSYHYAVSGLAAQQTKNAYGTIKVEIRGDSGTTGLLELKDLNGKASGVIAPGEVLTAVAAVGKSLGDPKFITANYQKGTCLLTCFLYANDVKMQEVTVKSGEDKKMTTFCLNDSPIANNMFKTANRATNAPC